VPPQYARRPDHLIIPSGATGSSALDSPRNRLSPRYINIAQDRYSIGSMAGANSTSTPKRKHKRKTRETNAEKGRIDENGDASQPLRPPENIHHKPSTWKLRVPSNTFKKGCDDDDAAARSDPRVSPGTRKDRETGLHPTPFKKEGWRPRASPRRCRRNRQRFLPTLVVPPWTLHHAPPYSPPTTLRHHGLAGITAVSP
jgi:hypothetical protein